MLLIILRDWEDKLSKRVYAERLARQVASDNLRSVDQYERAFSARSKVEQDAMAALCELAGQSADKMLKPDQVKGLVTALLVSYACDVISLNAKSPP